jgi:hypothetical protein
MLAALLLLNSVVLFVLFCLRRKRLLIQKSHITFERKKKSTSAVNFKNKKFLSLPEGRECFYFLISYVEYLHRHCDGGTS